MKQLRLAAGRRCAHPNPPAGLLSVAAPQEEGFCAEEALQMAAMYHGAWRMGGDQQVQARYGLGRTGSQIVCAPPTAPCLPSACLRPLPPPFPCAGVWLPQLYTRRQVANQSLLTGPDLQAALDNWDMVRWAWRWDRTAHLPETSPTRLSAAAALQPGAAPWLAAAEGGRRRLCAARCPI